MRQSQGQGLKSLASLLKLLLPSGRAPKVANSSESMRPTLCSRSATAASRSLSCMSLYRHSQLERLVQLDIVGHMPAFGTTHCCSQMLKVHHSLQGMLSSCDASWESTALGFPQVWYQEQEVRRRHVISQPYAREQSTSHLRSLQAQLLPREQPSAAWDPSWAWPSCLRGRASRRPAGGATRLARQQYGGPWPPPAQATGCHAGM